MENKPKRRWFRFSLRTMLVAVTVVALITAWTTYNLNWIKQRRVPGLVYGDPAPGEVTKAPWPLWLFGERGWDSIQIRVFNDEGWSVASKDWNAALEKSFQDRILTTEEKQQLEQLKPLFPEATKFHAMFLPTNLKESK